VIAGRPSLRDRLEGGLVGLLVGDSLGVPYEFHGAGNIPALADIEMTPPPGYPRTYAQVPPGTWSDDGAQALCLLASLLDRGGFDAEDFGRRLVDWLDKGYLAVDGRVFDVGITSRQVIMRIGAGTPAAEAGESGENSNGNGSLMRVLPLVLWHQGPDLDLVRDATAQSRVTHAHPRSQLSCALYCLWARRLLDATPDPWNDALYALLGMTRQDPDARAELANHVAPPRTQKPTGTGYVVDCLHSARHALEQRTYEGVVKAAIALGNDTDTTACVAGGLAGVRDGVDAIPPRWRDALRGRDLLQPLMERLLAHRAVRQGR
jgi:ADP-ribosyl-[dinitrogen reductase] hydrolase